MKTMMMLRAFLAILTFHAAAAVAKNHKRPLVRSVTPQSAVQQMVDDGLNSTAVDLFERCRRSYERTYPQYGRIPVQALPGTLTLDFEIETSARVQMTPKILLERGGVDQALTLASAGRSGLTQESGEDMSDTVWPKVSEWFTAGIDGTGEFVQQGDQKTLATRATGTYRQDLSGQIELESLMMLPKEVLSSNFTNDLKVFLEKIYAAKQEHADDNQWYRLPFPGSKGIHIFGSQDPYQPCNVCHVQWTAGLSLQHVSGLLRMTGESRLQDIIQKADDLCLSKPGGCQPEYHAFITLAAWVLRASHDCPDCSHTKRCMSPWLVRTHFGDLAMMMKDKFGDKILKSIPADVMEIGEFQPSDKILPHGTVDYLRLPEMAELSGMVVPRNPHLRPPHLDTEQDMPTEKNGLLQLAKRMLADQQLIDNRLRKRNCRLHSRNSIHATDFTVKDFLDGVQHGKDLMSDHDSPLSESSFSHMIWKSMGSWRMKPGSDRVYLECRSTKDCIEDIGMPGKGPSGLIEEVGKRMIAYERQMKKNVAREAQKKRGDLRRWNRTMQKKKSVVTEVASSGDTAPVKHKARHTARGAALMRRKYGGQETKGARLVKKVLTVFPKGHISREGAARKLEASEKVKEAEPKHKKEKLIRNSKMHSSK